MTSPAFRQYIVLCTHTHSQRVFQSRNSRKTSAVAIREVHDFAAEFEERESDRTIRFRFHNKLSDDIENYSPHPPQSGHVG